MKPFNRSREWWLARARSEPDVPIGAGLPDCPDASYSVYIPTLGERIGRLLGFRRRWPDIDANERAASMPGWAHTTITVHLDFGDRIRLLLTGKARIETQQRADVEIKEMISDSAFSVIWPFGDVK